ncbi:Probable exopolygalacturonase X [Taphrina deformans PYCC 5710]|uniref:Probable exopolygalacturonase X n=1 Tax=Taphrina deformans (strain PYCC 5710 / ATCC 11124 / CBS 356.35 / IMI 108563 / JCM 9778 / NBRC 8474) TaxID=1097556 RepID=R4X9V0_TAPDE|nr:Probable exopolygalacturonase X [Taphrina deformans PYCC 5710]|eukprot:CCG82515.1 Probable exopolygalacturonase X [Taphrina deformans PYCC 5710]
MDGISQALVEASVECQKNSLIVVESGDSLIDNVVVMKDLTDVEVSIEGTLHLKDDWPMWREVGYRGIPMDHNVTIVWSYVGGSNISVHGWGTINGHGTTAWQEYFRTKSSLRPALVAFLGVNGGSYSRMRHIDSPFWNLYFWKSQYFRVSEYQVDIHDGGAGSDTEAKNTDGFNTRDSHDIELFNSRIYNTDDIVAVKAGSENIHVHDVIGGYRCGGVSCGSFGNNVSIFETAKNVMVENVELRDCRAGVRIKTWAGRPAAINELTGGGGRGLVQNATYKNINVKNVETAITIQTCYGVTKPNHDCFGAPTKVVLKDVLFKNVVGTVMSKLPWKDPYVSNYHCSAGPSGCINVKTADIQLVEAHNKTMNPSHCSGICDTQLPGVLCDYPLYTKRRWNGTVQMSLTPKTYGPLINDPVLPVGYTSGIPAPDGLWQPRYPPAPAELTYSPIAQPVWPKAWDEAISQMKSPPPSGSEIPKPPNWGTGDDVDSHS